MIIYPFLHGPLLLFSIYDGDAFIPQNMSKTITYCVHAFGALISRRLYWHRKCENFINDCQINDTYNYLIDDNFNMKIFVKHYQTSMTIYFVWFLLYAIYLFVYDGNSINMIKYIFKLKDSKPTFKQKIIYLLTHAISVNFTICIGIIAMYSAILDHFLVGLIILSGLVQGAWYHQTGHKLRIDKLLFGKQTSTYIKIDKSSISTQTQTSTSISTQTSTSTSTSTSTQTQTQITSTPTPTKIPLQKIKLS
jgi:hypothetical protein